MGATDWVFSHFFRFFILLLGFGQARLGFEVANRFFLNGQLTAVREKMTVPAWFDLTLTSGIPFFTLWIWSYLMFFLPNIPLSPPHRRAHALSILWCLPVIIFFSVWSQVGIWSSTDSGAAVRFIFAPFATLSLTTLFYVVVWSLSFKVSNVVRRNAKRK